MAKSLKVCSNGHELKECSIKKCPNKHFYTKPCPSYEKIRETVLAWESYNNSMKQLSGGRRGVNLSENITEAIVAHFTGGQLITKGSGDVVNVAGNVVEVKGSSSTGPSSFSPSSTFDHLFFVKYLGNKKFAIYNLNMNRTAIEKVQINSTETFGDQAKQKRRPRFNIEEKIITPQGLEPVEIYDFN